MISKETDIDLSIVIVNYNVEYFLEQCLNSVFLAAEKAKVEVFVVDNNSVDGSVEMVKNKFPSVDLIANKTNNGFSKANNQAIKNAKGKYVLLLNPDTVVEEHTFSKVIAFMDSKKDAGGLGVRMVDGKGMRKFGQPHITSPRLEPKKVHRPWCAWCAAPSQQRKQRN